MELIESGVLKHMHFDENGAAMVEGDSCAEDGVIEHAFATSARAWRQCLTDFEFWQTTGHRRWDRLNGRHDEAVRVLTEQGIWQLAVGAA